MHLNEDHRYNEALPDTDEIQEQAVNPARKKTVDSKMRLLLLQSAICAIGILLTLGIKAIGGEVYSAVQERARDTLFLSVSADRVKSVIFQTVGGKSNTENTVTNDIPAAQGEIRQQGVSDLQGSLSDAHSHTDGNGQDGGQNDGQGNQTDQDGQGNQTEGENKAENTSANAKSLLNELPDNRIIPTSQNSEAVSKGPVNSILLPVDGELTSAFGYRIHPIYGTNLLHGGIDLGVESGTPVKAALPGVVKDTGYNGSAGNYVTLSHSGRVDTKYAHLSEIAVSKDQSVAQGQVIAYSGNTGVSTGPHLHFEIRIGGVRINPLWIMNI